jgi:hypothetical protein
MTKLPRIVTLVAASAVLSLGALATTPAAAFDNGYDNRPDQGWRERGWAGYNDEDYGRPRDYGYGRPGYEVHSGTVAICPPGYHLGRSGSLCWPD